MEYLLDSHTFLWFCSGSSKLSKKVRALIEEPKHSLKISIASIWELAIKNSIGKLSIEGGFESVYEDLDKNGVEVLHIQLDDILIQNKLDFYHRDPFDRLIIAQAINRDLIILGKDAVFDEYFNSSKSKRVW